MNSIYRKSLILAILGTINFHVEAISGGKDFKELNGKAIRVLSDATVGIALKDGTCTGVAISKNTLLTANHCTMDEKHKYINNNDTINLFVTNKHTLVAAKVGNIIHGYEAAPAPDGSDLAIIHFQQDIFQHYIKDSDILDYRSYKSINKEDPIQEAVKYIWNKNTKIFYTGWGSNRKFQIEELTPYENSAYFPVDLRGFIYEGEKIVETYNNVPNSPGKYYGYEEISPVSHEYTYNIEDDPKKASLTNIITIEDTGVEDGDSGGPVFACEDIKLSCKLIGITYGSIKGNDTGLVVTTLLNPYFDKLSPVQ